MTPHAPQRLCTACSRRFSCDSAYQLHYLGRRSNGVRCRTEEELRHMGMAQRSDGAWQSPRSSNRKTYAQRIKPGHKPPFA